MRKCLIFRTLRPVEEYQRAVVALIRASQARVSVLPDHRLVDLWREYSARQYRGGWLKGTRPEARCFVAWCHGRPSVESEVKLAFRLQKQSNPGTAARTHVVLVWGKSYQRKKPVV